MPFMKGRAPVRRTMKYLQDGALHLKSEIQVMTLNYNIGPGQQVHRGALDFVFWHLPQLLYKNPHTQFVTFKNLTPTPVFQFFFSNGKKLVIDVDSHSKDEIHSFIRSTLCKTEKEVEEEETKDEKNPGLFGLGSDSKKCICQIPGQVPCSGAVILPPQIRGKHRYTKES
ncbi:MRPS25 [Mytilus coruscus]|uniref:Small ribosomal subunit protein mS25 n=1 Tax=Mytilus coruscus TaxID=42192 RepID=A0A6J8DF45_MYTCO|nr:MRPS25 [Mytilus coruscus]